MATRSPTAPYSCRSLLRWLIVCVLATFVGCGALKQCAYEGFGRDSWQHPAKVIEALDIEPGDHIADLGAGSGYFTFLLAQAVGPDGKVSAVDVDRDMVDLLGKRVQEEGHKNVEVILADPDDPRLPRASLDLIFTCNVYHHMENRATYFSRVAKTLKPDGRVAVIDLSRESWFAWLTGHSTPAEVIEREMKEAGYALTRRHDFLPKQVFLIFTAR
jgi:arsenite methyltransferase